VRGAGEPPREVAAAHVQDRELRSRHRRSCSPARLSIREARRSERDGSFQPVRRLRAGSFQPLLEAHDDGASSGKRHSSAVLTEGQANQGAGMWVANGPDMTIKAALMCLSCLFLMSCAAAEPAETSEEKTGEAEQALCSSHCQCSRGYKCVNGTCTVPPIDFGPPIETPCFADCQCTGANEFCWPVSPDAGGHCMKPEISFTSGNWNSCGSNAGVAHPSPDALVRMTIVGKPGATVKKYNRHASCGGSATWWLDTGLNGATIPPGGMLSIDYPTSSPFACSDKILGRWENYVVVGGKKSDATSFTFYDSPCGGSLSTCNSASNYCPPSGPCNGLGCP
jgi:hypothetical protein